MARTLDQILSELNTTYAPSAQTIQSQMDLIPGQTAANISAADAAQSKAYQNILTGAQQRGIGFSGIPLGEQANYASTVYAPAVLQARNQGQQNVLTLQDALNKLNLDKYSSAQNIQQNEINNEMKQQQLNASLYGGGSGSSGGGGYAPTIGDLTALLGGSGQTSAQQVSAPQQVSHPRNEQTAQGFRFYDASNKPISMLQYAQSIGKGDRQIFTNDILQPMANAGDKNAQIALKYVNNNFTNVNPNDVIALKTLGISPNSVIKGMGFIK